MSELIPGGAQTISKFASRFPGAYPRSVDQAYGARVWDDGPMYDQDGASRGYIDWICALGAVTLGYSNHDVDDAVRAQVDRGPIFSLPNIALEERVAQRLVDLIPCAESVRFLKDGSCATEAAIRVARAATGRDVILTCGYHGWHSWYAATRDERPGVPEVMRDLIGVFAYNDLASLDAQITEAEKLYRRRPGVAAIILEPTLIEAPVPGFLAGVVRMAHEAGALVIFDEMVTGFRWHAGGAQALYGVTPDLACFGKGMGNGYPIAALVGRADLMRHARLVSGTFGGDCIGLAAADATLARYQQGGVTEHMWKLGALLIAGYNALAKTLGAPTRMDGQPPHPVIRWAERACTHSEGITCRDCGDGSKERLQPNRHHASLFFQETVRRGILFHPEGINVMLAHTLDDVALTLAACEAAMIEVMSAIGDGKVRERIEGAPISPEPAWRVAQ